MDKDFEAWADKRGVWPRLTHEEIWLAAKEQEREACAKVCETHGAESWDHEGGALACADKIRARSNV